MAQFLVFVKPRHGLTPQGSHAQQVQKTLSDIKSWVNQQQQQGTVTQVNYVGPNPSGIVAVVVVNANDASEATLKGHGIPGAGFIDFVIQPLTNLQQQTAGLTLLDFNQTMDSVVQRVPDHFQ